MSERDFKLYCHDILDAGNAVFQHINGFSFDDFSHDRKTFSAVIREFEIIGEAVGKLPNEIKQKHPDVEWQNIGDFRNLLTHEYFGVNLEIVWRVIQDDLPGLLQSTYKIIDL